MPHPPFLTAEALTAPGLLHGFFTRQGGVSGGIYAALQCGWGAKDDPADNVAENRARAARALGLAPDMLVSAYQAHTARAVVASAPWRREAAPEADGLASDRPGLALGVLTADCAPILMADAAAGVVGAAHAGWKGALGGVIEATLTAMTRLGARPERIAAAVGPCISQANYQVDSGFRARFLAEDRASEAFFGPDPAPDRARFDLEGYCAARLKRAGVGRVQALGRCTYGAPELFFSNRRALHRAEGDYGRGLSVIALAGP